MSRLVKGVEPETLRFRVDVITHYITLQQLIDYMSPECSILTYPFLPYFLCIGVLQADPGVIREKDQIFRLFCHEAQRVFHDRLINTEDKTYFNEMMSEMAQKYFATVSKIQLYLQCILVIYREGWYLKRINGH